MDEYQKIPGPYKRHTEGPLRNQVIEGEWTSPELAHLASLPWLWTEKVDGTNIRVGWDGHKVTYGGRTASAQIPARLLPVLDTLFPEELLELKFGENAATLYGEGYGAGIQKGGVYRPDMSFVLFDVKVGHWWLRRDDVEGVAAAMGLAVVPLVAYAPVAGAIDLVRGGLGSAWNPDHAAEGLVGVTPDGLLDRSGKRIMVKVKARDFPGPSQAA
jgi:RNA ligase